MKHFLIPTAEEGVFEVEFDNTSAENYITCHRRGGFYSIQKREPAKPNAALFFGSVIHEALVPRKLQVPNWEQEQMRIISKAYDENPVEGDEWRTAEQAFKIIFQYNQQYPLSSEDFTIVPGTVEMPFRIFFGTIHLDATLQTPIGSIYVKTLKVFYTGRIDAAINIYGTVFAMDHKTASVTGESYYEDFELSPQMMGYTWALRQLGHNCTGLLADVLEGRKPSRTGKEIVLRRAPYWYKDYHINEWRRDVFAHIVNFIEDWKADYFPKGTKWCHAKFGTCPYWAVCTQDSDEGRANMLASDQLFKNVDWSPLNDRS